MFEQRKRRPLRIMFCAAGSGWGQPTCDPLLVIDLVPFFEIVVSTYFYFYEWMIIRRS
jgi:hypothetical protein